MDQNRRKLWVWASEIGAAVVALCCVTPVLVVLLGALTGYLDYVLLPALVVFLEMIVYGLFGPRASIGHQCCAADSKTTSAADTTCEAKHR